MARLLMKSRALISRTSPCTPRQDRASALPVRIPALRIAVLPPPRSAGAEGCAAPPGLAFCTWGCSGLMDFNTCKQELLLAGTKAAPGEGLSPTLPALFPLRCFLSPSLSEFNEDNEISQAHFALQQLSNTFLTREKGRRGGGDTGRPARALSRRAETCGPAGMRG